ncbi:MAG: hypothetical protein AAGH17_04245 [Pseudomonadota bacterium]
MSITDDFPTYQEYLNDAGEALEKVSAYAEAAKKLQEAGHDLSTLQDIAKDLTWLSKLATGFQIAAAVLGVLGVLFGAKSEQEQIMDKLDALSNQIKDLQLQIAELSKQADLNAANEKLFQFWIPVVTANGYVNSYKYHVGHPDSDKSDLPEIISNIQAQSTVVYAEAANALLEILQGSAVAPAYLDVIYDKNYGDPSSVLNVTCYFKLLLDQIMQGHASLLVAKKVLSLPKGQDLTPDDALQICKNSLGDPNDPNSMAHVQAEIVSILDAAINRVGSTENLNKAVTGFLDVNIGEDLKTFAEWDDLCEKILNLLSDQYTGMRFCVIGYSGKKMQDRVGALVNGPEGPVAIFHYMDKQAEGHDTSNFAIFAYPVDPDADTKPRPVYRSDSGAVVGNPASPESYKRHLFDRYGRALNEVWDSERRKDQHVPPLVAYWALAKAHYAETGQWDIANWLSDQINAEASSADTSAFKGDFVWVGRVRFRGERGIAGDPSKVNSFGVASHIPIVIHQKTDADPRIERPPVPEQLSCVLCYPTLD